MSDKDLKTSETKSVAPGIFNLAPGPDYQTTNTYKDGSTSTGCGNTKSESQSNASKK